MTLAGLTSITPAQRLADTIVEERDLQPPIQIDELVQEVADIVPADLRDTGVDAILYGLHDDERPKILIDRESRPSRRLFTLAHEYGHLSMAWHQGTLSCSVGDRETTDPTDVVPHQVFPYERQADQFASRLLIPNRYLLQFDPEKPADLIEAVEGTNVSAEAAIYGLAEHLPAGYTFALLDSYGKRVRAVARSQGTLDLRISRGQPLDEDHLTQFFSGSGHQKYAGYHIYWGRHIASMELVTDSTDWRPILTQIMSDNGYDVTPSGDTWRSVNGVAAWSHGAVGHDNVEMLAVTIKQSFMRNPDHSQLAEHPRFNEYASARALDFANR